MGYRDDFESCMGDALLGVAAAAMHLDLVIDVFLLQQLLHRVDEAP